MGHRIRITSLLIVMTIVVSCAAVWWLLHQSLPQLDGTVRTPAVSAPVDVQRDALGTVTVRGHQRRDVSFALGYVHAQERFFEMDLLRRRAAGELAEVFGAVALPSDRTARAHRMRQRLRAEVATLPPEQRADLAAYRDGVNAGLDALAVRPFPYLITRTAPAPWADEDTLLAVAAMAFTLNDAENKRELAFARLRAALPASAYALLTISGGSWDAPLGGPALAPLPLPTPAELDLHALDPALLKPSETGVDRLPGSNAFAVAGALGGGAGLIANDMHLDLRVPALWFRARLVYPDPDRAGETIDVTGATLPGTPAMIVGSNRHVAWGFTNSYLDTTDWVRLALDPADASRYAVPGIGWASIATTRETIRVRGTADDTLPVQETRWGPILANDVDGAPLALAWTAQQPGAFNLDLERMERARDVDEALAIAQASGLPPQNLVVADRAGRIGWTIAGRLPKRLGGYDPALPADWSRGDVGWSGWLDRADYPRLADPADGRLWTANQRIVDASALAKLGDGGYDLGARAGQIRDGLSSREHFTPADLLTIQLDDRALFLQRWKDLLQATLERAPASHERDVLRRALADWTGHASIDSVAYRVVRAWRNEVVDRVLDGFAGAVRTKFPDFTLPKLAQGEYAVWAALNARAPHLLPPGYADWDALLDGCAVRVTDRLGGAEDDLAARTWGERNTTRIAHPLSRALPGFLARLLDMPGEPLPGDNNMPRVQGPAFGASERFGVAPGDEAHGYFMMAGGQSGHPLSPYYGSGHADWAAGRPTPFLPGAAEHTLSFVPAP